MARISGAGKHFKPPHVSPGIYKKPSRDIKELRSKVMFVMGKVNLNIFAGAQRPLVAKLKQHEIEGHAKKIPGQSKVKKAAAIRNF